MNITREEEEGEEGRGEKGKAEGVVDLAGIDAGLIVRTGIKPCVKRRGARRGDGA